MSLTAVEIAASIVWKMEKTNTGFKPTTHGPETKSFALQPAVATYNQIYVAQHTLGAAASVTIDLQSFTALDSTSVTLTKALAVFLTVTGSGVKIEPGASNPLTWFFSGTTPAVTIPAGGLFVFAQPTTQTVSAGAKTLKLTEVGGGTAVVQIEILGGT